MIDIGKDLKEAYEQGRADGRKEAIDECIALARAEIDFESQAEQRRFVGFMEQLKEQKNDNNNDWGNR